jgi:hypothetical protein
VCADLVRLGRTLARIQLGGLPRQLLVSKPVRDEIGEAAPNRQVTRETAIEAITIFRVDPTSERGRAAGGVILEFVESSPEVVVNITKRAVPFLSNDAIPLAVKSTLTAAFVAGNVDAQLLRGDKRDDPYAGVLQVIDTYRQMQRNNADLKIAEVEEFIEMEKRGELKAYVSS